MTQYDLTPLQFGEREQNAYLMAFSIIHKIV